MQDNVTYSMETFDIIEGLVNGAKREGFTYEYAMESVVNVIFQRQEVWRINQTLHEYDSANILATFNIIWGE